MLRISIFLALVLSPLGGVLVVRPAIAEPTLIEDGPIRFKESATEQHVTSINLVPGRQRFTADAATTDESETPPELLPEADTNEPAELPQELEYPLSLEDFAAEGDFQTQLAAPHDSSDSHLSKLQWLGLRHSSTHGRNAGIGTPLVGTSWMNRPFYVGGDFGTVWLTRPINDDLTNDIDLFGGVFWGCDLDYYWGTELGVHRATPEIINERQRDADRGDRLMLWTASLMYYPWGDALWRPYWRCGIGTTEIDFPTGSGARRDEALWTFPIGVGVKYPLRRWLAARAEFADQLAIGNHDVAAQHDFTLTFGLEWRYGAHPRSYWPWNPSRHIW